MARREAKAARVCGLAWSALLRRLDRDQPAFRD
jgi:hypothetical protein